MDILRRIPARYRKGLYYGSLIAAVAIAAGVVTPEQLGDLADKAVAVIAAVTALIAAANVSDQ